MVLMRKWRFAFLSAMSTVWLLGTETTRTSINSIFSDIKDARTIKWHGEESFPSLSMWYTDVPSIQDGHHNVVEDDHNHLAIETPKPKKNRNTIDRNDEVEKPESPHLQEQLSFQDSNNTALAAADEQSGMLFVHVGKAGGMTLRRATYLGCLGPAPVNNPRPKEHTDKCARNLPSNTVLPHRLRYVMHMFGYNLTQIQSASSYLFVIRHPVDRYISAFHFHRPEKHKNPNSYASAKAATACFYIACFPEIEELAQMSVAPWSWKNVNASQSRQRRTDKRGQGKNSCTSAFDCHRIASKTANGSLNMKKYLPHFTYNYNYYANLTIDQYADKAVYVIRTENEWQDIVAIDRQLGGTGEFSNFGANHTHGSERYKNEISLSTEGYHKLCCALVKEIEVYQRILFRAVNLNFEEKQNTMHNLYAKCGIAAWSKWRRNCLRQLEADKKKSGNI